MQAVVVLWPDACPMYSPLHVLLQLQPFLFVVSCTMVFLVSSPSAERRADVTQFSPSTAG
jgi:hypothetical protein